MKDNSQKQQALKAILMAAASLQTARELIVSVHAAFENAVEVRELEKVARQLNDLGMRVNQMKGL